jgi:Sulfotransferase family
VAVQPLFVFSVTRSGSTLVQRVLGSYDEIATVSEPWILFPHLYAQRKRGIWAEYTHYLMVEAIEDFGRQLPGGRAQYREEVRRHILRLYELAAGNAGVRYFLDKTPPYFLIVDEVMDLFPEGRFLFLWRSPLSVAASLIEWDGERWDPARYAENLFVGPARLTSAYSRNRERACAVRYEDLVTGGVAPWRRISDYLGLEFRPEALSRFASVRLEGRMGDRTGPRRYDALSTEPLTKWRRRLNTPVRKAWFARLLRWIGPETLAVMGYELDELLADLRTVPTDWRAAPADAAVLLRSLVEEVPRAQARRMLGVPAPSAFRYVLDLHT